LEGHRSIGQAYWHNQEFIMPIVGLKGSLPFISFLDLDLIVSIKKVNFTEDLGTIKLIEKFTNQWNRVAILYCDGIETSIINTEL
jgi:hypothetical protein